MVKRKVSTPLLFAGWAASWEAATSFREDRRSCNQCHNQITGQALVMRDSFGRRRAKFCSVACEREGYWATKARKRQEWRERRNRRV